MSELRTHFIEGFNEAVASFCQDIEALSHEQLDTKFNENTRRAYDYIYEVALVNRRFACRMRGEDPGPMPWEFGKEWLGAPDEYRNKEAAIEMNKAAAKEVTDAATQAADDEDTIKKLHFGALHTSYHDAQLNFIQTLGGDMGIHWNMG